jgi:hypothetical protein
VLETLQSYLYLPVDYIAALTAFSYDHLKKVVVPPLFHEGYVTVPPEAMQSYRARNRPRVIAIAEKGQAHLKDYSRWRPMQRKKKAFRHTFNGELTRASFEIAAREVLHLHLVRGKQILEGMRCPQSTRNAENPFTVHVNGHDYRPDDDLMGYRYSPPNMQPRWLFWFREDDRDTESYADIDDKLDKIIEIDRQQIHLIRYGIPDCLYCFVTISQARALGILDRVMNRTSGKGHPKILVKVISDFASYDRFPPATGHMARVPWQRAGFPQFNILAELGVV